MLDVLRAMLSSAGHTVFTAASGREALDLRPRAGGSGHHRPRYARHDRTCSGDRAQRTARGSDRAPDRLGGRARPEQRTVRRPRRAKPFTPRSSSTLSPALSPTASSHCNGGAPKGLPIPLGCSERPGKAVALLYFTVTSAGGSWGRGRAAGARAAARSRDQGDAGGHHDLRSGLAAELLDLAACPLERSAAPVANFSMASDSDVASISNTSGRTPAGWQQLRLAHVGDRSGRVRRAVRLERRQHADTADAAVDHDLFAVKGRTSPS